MFLLRLFNWLGQTPVGIFMQQSTYGFEIAEMFHLLALALLGGSILIIDLRLLGLGIKSQSPARLAGELKPCLAGSLLTSVVSGVLLLAAEPMKCYYNPAFRLKMLFLVLALLFYFFIQRPLLQAERASRREFLARSAGVVSLLLWLAVGLAGRAIGIL